MAHGIDASSPHWPTKDGVTSIAKPHKARNEIVVGKGGKKTSFFVTLAVQHQIWLHRGWWQFLEWAGHRSTSRRRSGCFIWQRGKLLLPPRLQQLLKRWRRLRIEPATIQTSQQTPAHSQAGASLHYGRALKTIWRSTKTMDNQRTNDRDGADPPGDV